MSEAVVHIESFRQGARFKKFTVLSRFATLKGFYPYFSVDVSERELAAARAGTRIYEVHYAHFYAEISAPAGLWSSVRLFDRVTGNMIASGVVCHVETTGGGA